MKTIKKFWEYLNEGKKNEYGVFIYDEKHEGEEPDKDYYDNLEDAILYAKKQKRALSKSQYIEIWKKNKNGLYGNSGEPVWTTEKSGYHSKHNKPKINETGEWSNDEEGVEWIKSLKHDVKEIESQVDGFKVISVKGFDKYQGPYATVKIHGNIYDIWTTENGLWIEDFPFDNTSDEDKRPGFEGDVLDIIDMLNHSHYNKEYFKKH